MKSIKIVLADDQPIIREGLATILADQKDIQVVGKAQNGLEAVQLVQNCHPDVVLLDILMPVMSGLDALAVIKESNPHIAVIMLTTFIDSAYLYEALSKGASGYVVKDVDIEQLVMSIRQCVKGQMVFPATIQPIFQTSMEMAVGSSKGIGDSSLLKKELHKHGVNLNEREYALVAAIFKGKKNQQIADELFLSLGTVKNYISQLYRKLNVSNRHELIVEVNRMVKERI